MLFRSLETTNPVFRIKAVQNDGSTAYSDAVADNFQFSTFNFQLSPNPATNTINISGLSLIKNYELRIMNKEGKEMYSSFIIQNSSFKINISSLPNGIYFLNIKNETGQIQSLKFVKE